MFTLPTLAQVTRAKQINAWDFGNKILYKLCEENFYHTKDEQILAKVLFIGRIYAAAVERRKNKEDEINDDFYIDTILPTFKNAELDKHLDILRTIKALDVNNIQLILQIHSYLTSTLNKITALDKRSFSSKYLHFHLPDLFFIYDSRALTGLRSFISHVPIDLKFLTLLNNVDIEYAKFYCKCFDLKRQIEKNYQTKLTIRQFDNILIEVANNKAKERKYQLSKPN